METKISKSLVMKAAWSVLKKSEVKNLSEALKAAWKAIKLKYQMASGVVTFKFRKTNGEIRKAVGTLKSGMFDYEAKGSTSKPSYSTVAYWDIEKDGFRSFRISSLL